MPNETKKKKYAQLVLVLLARPGDGTGGAEAPPPRVRVRGAALEPTRWRRHGATPGPERGVKSQEDSWIHGLSRACI